MCLGTTKTVTLEQAQSPKFHPVMCTPASSLLLNATQQALCCAGLVTGPCAICPNQDLSGIGVRLAFYIQSFLNAALIIFSPTDSSATAWACTLLTTALIIAGIVSKVQGNLTLHHALLVLNFATLSTISSLAVAPMLPIWRLTPTEYLEQQQRRYNILQVDANEGADRDNVIMSSLHRTIAKNPHNRKRAKRAQERARLVLSLALLLQITLQWAWGILLFISPHYAQPGCSGTTKLVMFLVPFTTSSINELEHSGGRFLLWPVWILFSLGITLFLAAYLASVGSALSQENHASSAATALSSTTPIMKQWGSILRNSLPCSVRQIDFTSVLVNAVMIGLWAVYIAASEYQIKVNCIYPGENSFGGLGQIVALIASGAPLWSLFYALYKFPARRRRHAGSHSAPTGSNDHHVEHEAHEAVGLLTDPTADGNHSRWQSDTSYKSGDESIEMQLMALPRNNVADHPAFPVPVYDGSPTSPAGSQPHLPVWLAETYRNSSVSPTVQRPSGSARPRGPRSASSLTRRYYNEAGT